MYKISIIIPVFNVEKTLKNAFNSILNQTLGFENIELIFVDDCSTDSSKNIIQNYVNKYSNVKAIYLEKNSGAAGKPRNIGIKNASSEYIMFLDPDDEFYDYSCEFLYNAIVKHDLDIVSGNYDEFNNGEYTKYKWANKGITESKICIDNIKEKMDLLRLPSSVFTKIFRKEFLLKNSIRFPEYICSEDLVFVCKCLLNAKGIFFIDKPLVRYKIRVGESKTSIKSKRALSEYLKAFTLFYDLIYDFDKEYVWFALIILDTFWLKLFILSDISRSDKIDILKSAKFLFNEFKKSKNISPSPIYKELFKLIYNEKYLDAVLLCEYISLTFPESKANLIDIIKKKDIYILFEEFDIKMGGVGSTVVKRANYLVNNGYNVTLLNVGSIKNFKYILNSFHNNGILSKKVDFINIFEYYSNKNMINQYNIIKSDIEESKSSRIEKIIEDDNSVILNYFSDSDELLKKEMYVDEYLVYEEWGMEQNYYNKYGFKYLSKIFVENKIEYRLYDYNSVLPLKFDNLNELVYHFITEIFISSEEKPFIICDSTSHWYNFNGISRSQAYKIGSMHGNPYLGDYSFGSPLNPNINHLKHLNELDALVLLTESVKNDLKKEFNYKNFVTIPNFISNEFLEYDDIKKDLNKISIFSRISPEKQISDAIKAFKIVSENNNNITLEIYGRALDDNEIKELNKLKLLTSELNLDDKIIFKGFIENVSKEMQKSLFTLLVSQREGLPLSLLESMANNTPVICYDVNYGPRDVITNGKDGIIIEKDNINLLAKEMMKLINNPEYAIDMGIMAKKKIETKFSANSVGLLWENLFVEIYAKAELEAYIQNIKVTNKYKIISSKNKKIIEENKKLKKVNNNLINSKSWKLTKPLRLIVNLIKQGLNR